MQNINLNSEQVGKARELLKEMAGNLKLIAVQFQYEDCLGIKNYDGIIIEQLILDGLIISYDIQELDEINTIHFIKLTEIGSALALFSRLAIFWDEGVDSEISFITTGNIVYSILNKYDEHEIENLVKLLTLEEQEAYQHYYKTQIWLKQNTKNVVSDDQSDSKVLDITLAPMFELSVELGTNGENQFRTNDYVFKKCMEELGEMALEDQIELGLSYKDAGSDGVAGEAVDLAICAMDMFALQFPGSSAKEIEIEFIKYMNKKLQKWRTIVGK